MSNNNLFEQEYARVTTQAAVRARQLIVAWVMADEPTAQRVRADLVAIQKQQTELGGYPHTEWEVLVATIGLFALGDRLAVFGVNIDKQAPGDPIPDGVVEMLDEDISEETDHPRKLALRVVRALADGDDYHVEVNRLLGGTVDFWPLVTAQCDLIVAERMRQARAKLLTECLDGIAALLGRNDAEPEQ
ncbi:hypothetical protein [Jongsikchunia kroppenstedtii]|uniref:hypothetical protein n=1 Tax=Jongsikchunia kroppenstedtii TaxID=1121721 RepID=UPI0003699AC3|nr:hypothetical protein [Jongsikchunia kroppenstedtii]